MRRKFIFVGLLAPAGYAASALLIFTTVWIAEHDSESVARAEEAPAQESEVNIDSCRSAIDKNLAKEWRVYRSVLFGRKPASLAGLNEVRYDREDKAWLKIDKFTWERLGENNDENITASNSLMDALSEIDSIPAEDGGIDLLSDSFRGIFDTKRKLTSEIVPNLAQALRSFSCRVDMVCELANKSTGFIPGDDNPENSVKIEIPGCMPVNWTAIPQCLFAKEDKGQASYADINQYCPRVAAGLLGREAEILKMLVEYDSAYRSILQFAGVFDDFLLEFKWMMNLSLRQAASVIGNLGKLPCFIATCDTFPMDLDPNAYGEAHPATYNYDSSTFTPAPLPAEAPLGGAQVGAPAPAP
ncbi:MAG: hypothetical protein UX30_C0004G0056 [Candidatus Saccharibacteria bacterium GW2011_GWA2_46_10]|nr:MAG: hypothetical protein UX30_C0004G0056 [Candidatus Saccharibacteria bacterium GW2011_GWA2_46_10]